MGLCGGALWDTRSLDYRSNRRRSTLHHTRELSDESIGGSIKW